MLLPEQGGARARQSVIILIIVRIQSMVLPTFMYDWIRKTALPWMLRSRKWETE